MKRFHLFLMFVLVFPLFFVSEISACSCLCSSNENYDSLLNIRCTVKGTQPDSTLTKFLSQHENFFLGTIGSIKMTGNDTESVQVKIDTVIKGLINQKSFTLINVPHRGDCVSSVKGKQGLSFLGYIDPQKAPVHLRDLGFFIVVCGNIPEGYLYRSGSLVRLGSVVTDSSKKYFGDWICTTEVFLFDVGKLYTTYVKEKFVFRNTSANSDVAPQYYSIAGEKLNKPGSNSVTIISNNKRKNTFFKFLKLEK